jgi:hypothetical protein
VVLGGVPGQQPHVVTAAMGDFHMSQAIGSREAQPAGERLNPRAQGLVERGVYAGTVVLQKRIGA